MNLKKKQCEEMFDVTTGAGQ